ncbi:sensor histidine kinase [Fulvivirga sediminis]|uniref:histidine kinase n=1 Tax=Fulvivirga sediminis TaxID=2803949 RepID=A0A937K377_9BACT|nr:ATP-binding protein [Fulvivirga sediminis]MBL3658677.1 GHKL domain-containing protein [Fulvivirga sediminis]
MDAIFFFRNQDFSLHLIPRIKWVLLPFCFFLSTLSFAQNIPFTTYTASDYNASSSNWSITQDENGLFYFANYQGVLIFDGITWELIPLAGQNICLSIAYTNGKIFVGSKGDLGYLQPDYKGKLHFESLNSKLSQENQTQSWFDIKHSHETTYFYSNQCIVGVKNDSIFEIKSDQGPFGGLFEVADEVYTYVFGNGIYKLENNTLKKLKGTDRLTSENIAYIDEKDHQLIIATNKNVLYSYKNGYTKKLNNASPESVISSFASSSNPPQKYNKAIGTLGKGLYFLTPQYNPLKTGFLENQTIKKLYFDHYGNLWSASQENISHFETSSPLKISKDIRNETGSILSLIKWKGSVYMGTTTGLFLIKGNSIEKVPGINAKVWSLIVFNSKLMIGSEVGLYQLKENLQKVSEIRLISNLSHWKNNLIIGSLGQLNILSARTEETPEIKKKIKMGVRHFNDIMQINDSTIWLHSKFDGVYKLDHVNRDSVIINKYTTSNGLPDVNDINIFNIKDRIIFSTSKGFYHFNPEDQTFSPDTSISKTPYKITYATESEKGIILSTIDEHNYNKLVHLSENGEEITTPFKRIPNISIDLTYYVDSTLWIAGSNGLYTFDYRIKKDYSKSFPTVIRRVTSQDSAVFLGHYYSPNEAAEIIPSLVSKQTKGFIPKLDYEHNEISFQYSASFYEVPEGNVFSHYLENEDKGWSRWDVNHKKEYSHLPPGDYVFHVKSKNIYGIEGKEATYSFTILPPWYMTWWAYFGYAIVLAFLIWGVVLAYTYRVRMQRQKLKLIVADRTFEVISQKKEIEKQKNLLQNQYEQIKVQRDDIQAKNLELSQAQKRTYQTNLALQELNGNLELQVEERTKEIQAMLTELQKTNKELDHFIYRASHDLKGPISRISGLTTLAKLEIEDGPTKNYLHLIDYTANNMKGTLTKLTQVHDLMTAEVVIEEIDIATLLSDIKHSLKHLDDQDLNTKYTFDFKDNLCIKHDKYRLNIILSNLLENAIVYKRQSRDEHSIHINIRKNDKNLMITVTDTGIGIEPDQKEKVFNMFYKANDIHNGSGLGLYLVKLALQKLNGSVTVESKVNTFTTFTVQIGLAESLT